MTPPPLFSSRHRAEIAPAHTAALFERAVDRAAELLRDGGVVALPTETVYGLAANALDPAAVRRLFEIKGRSPRNPIIVHVQSLSMARRCTAEWPDAAEKLAGAFWPGALTVVLRRSALIPDAVSAGGETVGVRWPAHPLIQAVIERCGFPLAAPSANLSNQVSPTTATHVQASLGDRIALIVDGGPCGVGIESTVVDLTGHPPVILRPGIIHAPAIAAVIGSVRRSGETAPVLRSPGNLPRHYAPKGKLRVWNWEDDEDLKGQLSRLAHPPKRLHVLSHTRIPVVLPPEWVSVIPRDAKAFARALYAELRRGDECGADWIIVEGVPDTPEWEGVADRLRRASAEAGREG